MKFFDWIDKNLFPCNEYIHTKGINKYFYFLKDIIGLAIAILIVLTILNPPISPNLYPDEHEDFLTEIQSW